jgi:Tfp pilus assembly protein PilO
MLREFQGLAREAGLQMTKFVTGAGTSGEFAGELPVTVEVAGGLRPVVRYLEGCSELPGLWIVDRFTLRAAAPDDPRTEVRAAVTVRAYSSR